jgi:MFS family permease
MFVWGIINMCMGFVHSYGALVALRFLLGAFEAGVLPGIIYVTAMYYKRHEYQKRMSFLFCSTLVGGAFGGLLAFAIAKLGYAPDPVTHQMPTDVHWIRESQHSAMPSVYRIPFLTHML